MTMNADKYQIDPCLLGRRRFLQGLAGTLPLLWTSDVLASPPLRRPGPESDLVFLRKHLTILPRNAWIRETPLAHRMLATRGFDRITVHHTGAAVIDHIQLGQVVRSLNGIHAGHMRRNYGDIGYHFIIDYAGRIWEGRSLAYQGAHVSGHNDGNLGIMLLGNFQQQHPADVQLGALSNLTRLIRERHLIKRAAVYAHRDLTPTECPGTNLYRHVSSLRSQAS